MANNALPVGHDLAWFNDLDFAAARENIIPPNGRTTYGKTFLVNTYILKGV